MRFFQQLAAAICLSFTAIAVSASPASPQNNVDFRTLDKRQPTESGKKVEVLEFFWYSCPHCNALELSLADWVKKQGNNIAFKRVPVVFRPSMLPQQKLYYTLEALGKLEELHRKVFGAIHGERKSLDTEEMIADFIEKQGIDKKKFLDTYNSFGVQAKARRASQLQEAYKVEGVPMMAVDGRFITSPAMLSASLGTHSEQALFVATFHVLDWLVAKAGSENKAQADTKVAQSR